MKCNHFPLLGLLAMLAIGCSNKVDSQPEPEVPEAGDAVLPEELEDAGPAPAGQTEEEETNPSEPEPVTLEIKNWEETEAVIAAAKGQVVVVDIWATYCAPCLQEFPNLVKLHQEHSDKVKCISVSLDYEGRQGQTPEDVTDQVLEVLKRQKATFQNILCSVESIKMYDEILKRGSIPIIFVYNQSGEMVAEFPNPENPAEFTYQEDVIPVVMNLIN